MSALKSTYHTHTAPVTVLFLFCVFLKSGDKKSLCMLVHVCIFGVLCAKLYQFNWINLYQLSQHCREVWLIQRLKVLISQACSSITLSFLFFQTYLALTQKQTCKPETQHSPGPGGFLKVRVNTNNRVSLRLWGCVHNLSV